MCCTPPCGSAHHVPTSDPALIIYIYIVWLCVNYLHFKDTSPAPIQTVTRPNRRSQRFSTDYIHLTLSPCPSTKIDDWLYNSPHKLLQIILMSPDHLVLIPGGFGQGRSMLCVILYIKHVHYSTDSGSAAPVPQDTLVLWSCSAPGRFLAAVASLERETRQDNDGSKVSSLTFRPLEVPTDLRLEWQHNNQHVYQITRCRLYKWDFTPP